MSLLSRIFRRTPSLRTRVALVTAIAAAIVVGIVGTVVWVGITDDRKERLAIVGDLVVDIVPFMDTACADGWLKALDEIEQTLMRFLAGALIPG